MPIVLVRNCNVRVLSPLVYELNERYSCIAAMCEYSTKKAPISVLLTKQLHQILLCFGLELCMVSRNVNDNIH